MAKGSTEVPAPQTETPKTLGEQMIILMDQADEIKPGAIPELIEKRDKLNSILERLGYKAKSTSPDTPICRICLESGHDARKHKNLTKGEKEKLHKAALEKKNSSS